MSVFEDARKGILVGKRLGKWISSDPSALDSQDPTTGWTPLATAVVSGYPRQVEDLLERGANPSQRCKNGETPLLLATWQAPFERARMVQILLAYAPKQPEALDKTCPLARNLTPLMYAVNKVDFDSVRLLVKAGANPHLKNDDGRTAEDLAKRTGKRSLHTALFPEIERSSLARFSSGVIKVARHIVFWYDNRFKDSMSKRFGFKGERDESIEKRLKEMDLARKEQEPPQAPTPEEFAKSMGTYIAENPTLGAFFRRGMNDRFLQDMAKKLADLANDPTTDLGAPDLLPKTIKVTMHQQIIYCDDSSSMINTKGRREERWESQNALCQRIARLTTEALPDGEGVGIRFINQTVDDSSSLDFEGIGGVLGSVTPNGDTPIGTTLQDRILKPLVFDALAKGEFKRPLLISILTDGAPSQEAPDKLSKVIIRCGDDLEQNGYPRDCVKFLIGQIGSSADAVGFLDALRGDGRIATVSHIYAGRMDDKYKALRDERGLDRWLVETLFEPIAAAEVTKK
ncbi:hypothetical protein QBC39DRAFT_415165 [Podospora conica]|nr:hypothetical protein QBC39DRAFT_415165 [Schizothecium conicum]